MLPYYAAFALIAAVAAYTAVYAVKTWRLRNRRGAIGLLVLDGVVVVVGWWVLFAAK